ncbi:hypothetical protein KPH14_003214 [Odynerus spinipes]|uniref:RETREG1-3/ARL6IP-like N-terminal reticulon-homology domain-containing protein n=1 Tax=Odynerus spinipes TaxID=1348599 RepID=A0AAD9RXQ1_9HYME|nr:hypothetical protein KPH14_003214 [Odynerus spinipes]
MRNSPSSSPSSNEPADTSSLSPSCDATKTNPEAEATTSSLVDEECRNNGCGIEETSRRFCGALENILLWENSVNSITVVFVFNILFWGIIILEIRGFAAASSAALVVVLCYRNLEAQAHEESKNKLVSHTKAEQIEKIGRKIKSILQTLKQLRKDQPGAFCTAVCTISLGLWIIGRTLNGVLLAYTICMSILLVPALLLKLPREVISHKEWDSEVEEFLPIVTEDNLQLLKRAGESGDHSPTPSSLQSDVQNDFFNDEKLIDLRMPSHDDESIDEVELSELELSAEETDIGGIKFQSKHFEKGSSSEEEIDFKQQSNKIFNPSDDSDNEFEIIDSQEIATIDDA